MSRPSPPRRLKLSSRGAAVYTLSRMRSITHLSEECHSSLPPVSNHFISKEINNIKEELSSLKSDLVAMRNRPPAVLSTTLQLELGNEIKTLRDDVNCLKQHVHTSSQQFCAPEVASLTTSSPTTHQSNHQSSLSITSWNCRGLKNAIPYLNHLISEGTDIIALSEHWLWPYQLQCLENIHPDFDGFGVSDSRLNEHSDLTRGCGGVGIIWRRSLLANPIKKIVSDRFCVLELSLSPSQTLEPRTLNVIPVYLPSSDHSLEEYAEYLTELTSIVSAIEGSAPVLLLGDFNAHLPLPGNSINQQGNLLLDFIQHQNLFVASSCSIVIHLFFRHEQNYCRLHHCGLCHFILYG